MNMSLDFQKISDLETGPFKSDPINQQKQVIPWMHYELVTVGPKYTEKMVKVMHL